MKHLLAIEYLSKQELLLLLENAENMVEVSSRELKKVPALRGKTIINLFYETSTRTRTSFEIAGKRLSADVINIAVAQSSVTKGETLLDTAKTLHAMRPDAIVVRHASSGVPDFLASQLHDCCVINAGDGMREHPTQALLDCLTLKQYFSKTGRSIDNLTVAIVGDVLHSRVARSNIWAHLLLGNKIRLVGPPSLVPQELAQLSRYQRENDSKISIVHDIGEGIRDADVVMCLRIQTERLQQFYIPNTEEYSRTFGINEARLKSFAPHSVVLHPGPANRGIEVSSEVLDGPRSLISQQVENGVAVRMAVLFSLMAGPKEAQL